MHQKFWTLAWPLILTNITVPLLGLVDTAVLGHLDDPTHLAAVALAANLFTCLYWSFGFLKMGTSGITAQAHGRHDQHDLIAIPIRALTIAAFLASAFIILQSWIIPIGLNWLNASGEVYHSAAAYAGIRIWSAPAVLCHYVLTGWLIGTQQTKAALLIATTINVINIILDILFVQVLGMTSEGVALATLIADYIGCTCNVMLLVKYYRRHPASLTSATIFSRADIKQLLTINIDLFIRTALLLFTFAFFYANSAALGTNTLAANAVLLTFLLIISNALDGFANAAEAICGEAIGNQNRHLFASAVRVSMTWSCATALLLTLFFWIGGSHIIQLLTTIDAVIFTAQQYLVWIILFPIIGVWSYLYDGLFIAAGLSKAMRNTMAFAAVGVYLPAWWATQHWHNHGLWFALGLFLVARGASQAWIFHQTLKHQRLFNR